VGSEDGPQVATVLSYKETCAEWPDTENLEVVGVNYNAETGVIGIRYAELFSDQTTVEFWQGGEYIESIDWVGTGLQRQGV
jgi:hypothetical protein